MKRVVHEVLVAIWRLRHTRFVRLYPQFAGLALEDHKDLLSILEAGPSDASRRAISLARLEAAIF